MADLPPAPLSWSSPAMARIVQFVGDRAGLFFSEPRRRMVDAAIQSEARRVGARTIAEYHDALTGSSDLLDALATELTIGETYFLRHTEHFELLRENVLPALAAARANGPITIWSAGCATGEEAYSLAMICNELGLAGRVRIVGTDISRQRLKVARAARFGRWSMRGVPDEIRDTYFTRRDANFDLDSAIRSMVEFRYLNLAELGDPGQDGAPSGVDLILCRNVLIYFDAETGRRVSRQLVRALAPGGWLLLGASDPPLTGAAELELDVLVTRAGLVYRRRGGGHFAQPLQEVRPVRADAPLFETPATPSPSAPDVPAGAFSSPAQERAIMAPPPPPPVPETERPRDGESFLAEVRALADAGYLEAAGQACTRALEQYPLSAELTYLQAVLLLHAGHAGEAADAARRAIYLDRTLAVAHLALGDALARLGHANDAARSFRVAHRLLSGLPEDAVVPGSGGESGARLSAVAAARLRLMERAS